MKESDLWAALKRLPWDYAERQEPGATNAGVPDVLLVHNGVIRFIELKNAVVNKQFCFKTTSLVRPSQIRWHRRFQAVSPESYFLIGVGANSRYLISGRFARDLARGEYPISDAYKVDVWSIEAILAHCNAMRGR